MDGINCQIKLAVSRGLAEDSGSIGGGQGEYCRIGFEAVEGSAREEKGGLWKRELACISISGKIEG